jgi:maleate isomerase
MKRRHFIALGAAAGLGTPRLGAATLPAAQGPEWRPDGAGSVARIGVLTPDFDPVPESELSAMAPRGVSVHGARVLYERSDPRTFAEPPHVDAAAEQLAALAPRVILFAFTSSSYALGAGSDNAVRARLERRSRGIRVLLTCPAATEALRALGVRRLALIHPPWFTEEVNGRGLEYFESQGFDVVRSTRLSPARAFTEVPPAEVYAWARGNVPDHAEAVFVGGNGLRAVGAIHALEEGLGKPVLTANQVLLWQALRLAGAASAVTQYGRVFAAGRPARGG